MAKRTKAKIKTDIVEPDLWKEITTYSEAWDIIKRSWALIGWFNDTGESVFIMTANKGDGRIKMYATRGYKIGNRRGSRIGILAFPEPRLKNK